MVPQLGHTCLLNLNVIALNCSYLPILSMVDGDFSHCFTQWQESPRQFLPFCYSKVYDCLNLNLQITRKEVDSFNQGRRIPSCQLTAEWTKPSKPSRLIHKVTLKGAKGPSNYFRIVLDLNSVSVDTTESGELLVQAIYYFGHSQLLNFQVYVCLYVHVCTCMYMCACMHVCAQILLPYLVILIQEW